MENTNTPHILIADDEIDSLLLMRHFFLSKGWFVDTANAPIEITQMFNDRLSEAGEPYDALLTDINFFGQTGEIRKTGVSAASEIRRASREIPIIFVSAYVNEIIREQIALVGAAVLTKPVDLDELYRVTVKMINFARMNSASNLIDETAPASTPLVLGRLIAEAKQKNEVVERG